MAEEVSFVGFEGEDGVLRVERYRGRGEMYKRQDPSSDSP